MIIADAYPYLIAPGTKLPLQRNALRIEIIPPQPRCALRPKSDFSVIIRSRFNWNTQQLSRICGDFDYCVDDGRGCKKCPFYRRQQECPKAPSGVVIRSDPTASGVWWLVDQKSGWSRFGYFYPSLAAIVTNWAIDLDTQGTDEYGKFWSVVSNYEIYSQKVGGK